MALLSQALHLGYLLSPHSAFQGHAAHTARWPARLSPNGSSDTCISDGVFHIPMPCFHGAPPQAHSVPHALAGPDGTVCVGPVHRHLSPSRAAPARPTGRASPRTAHDACDTALPAVRGMLRAVACPEPSPRASISGNRVRHERGE